MSIPYSLTPFKLTDMLGVLRLERDTFQTDAYDAATFVMLYLRGREAFLVAREQETIIGYVIGVMDDETGYISSIAVASKVRGRGLGRALMEAVMARLIEQGARRFGLHVRQDNAAAIHLYETLGFVLVDRILDYYEDGSPAFYMERRID
jgi:[ribosomal protein S18]-alanine N-acetyltransferase